MNNKPQDLPHQLYLDLYTCRSKISLADSTFEILKVVLILHESTVFESDCLIGSARLFIALCI